MSTTINLEEGTKTPTNNPDAKDVNVSQTLDAEDNDNKPEEGSIIAPDQFDARYETSRKEIWSYYACVCPNPSTEGLDILTNAGIGNRYYIGNNGLTLFSIFPPPPNIFESKAS